MIKTIKIFSLILLCLFFISCFEAFGNAGLFDNLKKTGKTVTVNLVIRQQFFAVCLKGSLITGND